MSWSSPADLRTQLRKLWDNGRVLASLLASESEPLFPLRLVLKGPNSSELSQRFAAVREWVNQLQRDAATPGYRVVLRDVRHRVIGSNAIPSEVWIDTLDDALALLGKQRDAARFRQLLALTRDRAPTLLAWLARRPLRALDLADEWPRLLDVVHWLQQHPRPNLYLRQVDLPGVHSKFIENHRGVLAEWLDLTLPASAIDTTASGIAGFAQRYGFRNKPARVRLRLLDPRKPLLATATEQDLTLTHDTFARFDPDVSHVFITENEINFLAFPQTRDALVIFGAGYGFDMLVQAAWLGSRHIHYWGDIDTHGFAILDQLRSHFGHADSFLMDRATLLAHESQWGEEDQPTQRDLPRLTTEERALYDELRDNRIRAHLRLEQERIGFGWVEAALANLIH